MKSSAKKQEGQAIVIIAFALIALLALLALVVDAGNAYVQRRMVQNAMDAGAQAGALAFANGAYNNQIIDTATHFVNANLNAGSNPPPITLYWVLQDANGNQVVDTNCTVASCTAINLAPPTTLPWNGQNLNVVGVQVQGGKNFNTYFAGLVGWSQMQEQAASAATCYKGASTGENLFPIGVSNGTYVISGTIVLKTEQDYPSWTYTFYESGTSTKNIVYLRWSNSQGTDGQTLAGNMNNANSGASGPWAVGDQIPGATGTDASMSNTSVQSALNSYFQSGGSHYGKEVTMPVVTGTLQSAPYTIVGFARFRIVGANYGTTKSITVKLEDWVDPQAEGGGTNYGIVSCKLRPQLPPPARQVDGEVKIDKVIPSPRSPTYIPPDIVEVLDISGSMNCDFTGQNSSGSQCIDQNPPAGTVLKIDGAKSALNYFNYYLRPDLGDRAALVTFPKSVSGSYTPACWSYGTTSGKFQANALSDFTSNITGTNGISRTISTLGASGGTPTSAALAQAYTYLTGANHTRGDAGVVVLATDGIADVTTSVNADQWTGSNSNSDSCNDQAVQDAVDQANKLKAMRNDGTGRPIANIFVVAVGADFNANAIAKIATPDTGSQQHVWQATNASSMQGIYNLIRGYSQDQQDDCPPSYEYPLVPNVVLNLKNTTTGDVYTGVTTDAGGHYSITGVQPGLFQVTSASVTVAGYTYSVFEDQNGGDVIANPSTQVGIGSGVYTLDVFLETSQTIGCSN